MTSLPEQFSAVRKAQFEAQFDFFNSFATQALESASRVVALNLATSRDSVQRSIGATFTLMNSRDPRDFLSFGGQAEEQVRSLFSYGQELFGIASSVRPFALPSLPAAFVPQVATETVEVVEHALAAPVAAAAVDAAPAAAPEAAPEPAVVAEAVAAEPAVAPGPTVVAEPAAVAEPETDAEALAAVAEPAPAAEPTAIAKAAGKGDARAAVVPHPSSAPVETANIAEAPKLVTRAAPSKRRK